MCGIHETYGRARVDKLSEELPTKDFKPSEWNEFV